MTPKIRFNAQLLYVIAIAWWVATNGERRVNER